MQSASAGRYRFRFLTLSLAAAVLLIEILVLALLEGNFKLRKKEITYDLKKPIMEILERTKQIDPQALREIRAPGALAGEATTVRVQRAFREVMALISEEDFPAVELEIANATGEILYRDSPANAEVKRRHLNTWENSLFTRDFEFITRGTVPPYEFRVHFVSYPGIPEVRQLVLSYRSYAVIFTLSNLLVSFLLYSGAIRPLARIAQALEFPPGELPPIVPRPRHTVEHAYNTLARATRLTSVNFGLSDLAESRGGPEGIVQSREFWTVAVGIILRGMGYRCVVWLPQPSELENCLPILASESESQTAPAWTDLQMIVSGEGEVLYQSRAGGRLSRRREWEPCGAWLAGTVQCRGQAQGVLLAEPESSHLSPEIDLPYFRATIGQISLILTRTLERMEALDRDRYEVSIDLSASMGHDLTNILATGKLELETLRAAFRRGIIEVPEEKKEPVLAALEGLRKTTVLLQEVVNVYRAFSFTREPRFEKVELNALASEVIDLYRHSTSRKVEFDLSDGIEPVCAQADSRLLKLVLFNLLANATHAIVERQVVDPEPPGKVEISCAEQEGWAILRVSDNGTGFQNRLGERLEGVELQQIFQFDFTTKRRQGGLGLAWVKSIVTEIHGGMLIPSNRLDGTGAVMEVRLPLSSEGESPHPSPTLSMLS